LLTAIVIDDDRDLTEVFSELLELNGVRVLGFGYNGKDAVQLYKKYKPDIVFLDLMMPQYDGFYGLEGIKTINQDAFVIVMTADVSPETTHRVAILKASKILYKPFHFESTLDKIINSFSFKAKLTKKLGLAPVIT
jgi:DNA-binding response OmpR family regulator